MEDESTPSQAVSSPPLQGTIALDWPCVACRYNLRGLSVNGCCPECGSGVRGSLNFSPLTVELASLLERLSVSLGLLGIGFFVLPILVAICLRIISIWRVRTGTSMYCIAEWRRPVQWIQWIAAFEAILLSLTVALVFLAPDPTALGFCLFGLLITELALYILTCRLCVKVARALGHTRLQQGLRVLPWLPALFGVALVILLMIWPVSPQAAGMATPVIAFAPFGMYLLAAVTIMDLAGAVRKYQIEFVGIVE